MARRGAGCVQAAKLYLTARHGSGLGRLLLQHCEREARNLGATRLTLTVNKERKGDHRVSTEWFCQRGFRGHGHRRRIRDG
jgi:N-acetylglutamate synthase-like GNAT family acetyltransferase